MPRKHVETITVGGSDGSDGKGQEQRDLRLGAWVRSLVFVSVRDLRLYSPVTVPTPPISHLITVAAKRITAI
ncbi:hypothetical protein, partial [Streptomyces sp. NPDC002346]